MVCPIHCACAKFEYWKVKMLKLLTDAEFEQARGECMPIAFSNTEFCVAARAYCHMVQQYRGVNSYEVNQSGANILLN